MTDLVLPAANNAAPRTAASMALSLADVRYLLLTLGLASGMEFYTFNCFNLVLADLTGKPGRVTR